MRAPSESEPMHREVARRLRRDATDWQGAPSPECVQQLQRRFAVPPAAPPRKWLPWSAAALVCVTLGLWGAADSITTSPETAPPSALAPAPWIAGALQPLQQELDALGDDASAIGLALWDGTDPLRRLLPY